MNFLRIRQFEDLSASRSGKRHPDGHEEDEKPGSIGNHLTLLQIERCAPGEKSLLCEVQPAEKNDAVRFYPCSVDLSVLPKSDTGKVVSM